MRIDRSKPNQRTELEITLYLWNSKKGSNIMRKIDTDYFCISDHECECVYQIKLSFGRFPLNKFPLEEFFNRFNMVAKTKSDRITRVGQIVQTLNKWVLRSDSFFIDDSDDDYEEGYYTIPTILMGFSYFSNNSISHENELDQINNLIFGELWDMVRQYPKVEITTRITLSKKRGIKLLRGSVGTPYEWVM